jgi:hypothetical protein
VPTYHPTDWRHVQVGDTVVGRDGQPRLILDISRTTADLLYVRTRDGVQALHASMPALLMTTSMQESVISILLAFPGSTIEESTL